MPAGGEKFGAWYDKTAADLAVAFFPKYLRLTTAEWAGRPFVLGGWQEWRIIRPVFGWKREDGTRLIRTVYLEIPRKNGKTELASGVSLIALMADGEFGGEIYTAAVDENQAKIAFNKACAMVRMSEPLAADLEVFKTSIFCPALQASIKPLSSKPGSKHGFNPSGLVADEIHEWPSGDLYQVIHDGEGARSQPLEFLITTAGVAGEGFGWEQHEYAVKVRDGVIEDPSFLPVIFAADAEDDWTDPATWAKANPGLGTSPKLEFLADQCRKAQESPRLENNFKRFHLNLWTEQAVRWIPMEKWRACRTSPVTLETHGGRRCWGGLDLSSTTDITALVLGFEAAADDTEVDLFCRFWMPEEGLNERVKRDRVPYDQWAAQGFITLTQGNVVDYDAIRAAITGGGERAVQYGETPIIEQVDLVDLAIDRWNATQITSQLLEDGVEVVQFGQGFASMSAPAKEWERQVTAGILNHADNPVLTWMMSNTEVKTDPAGNIKPVKPDRQKSSKRIDGIVAGLMAVARLTADLDETITVSYTPGQMFA